MLNLCSVFCQKLMQKEGSTYNVYGITVFLINLAHWSNAVPLLILWTADLTFQNEFVIKEESWKSGPACFIHFFFELCNLFFNSASVCFFAISRLMIVLYPMDTKFKRTPFVSKIALAIVLAGIVYSSFVTFLSWYFGDNNSLPSSLCSPFVDPSYCAIMIQITIWTTSIFQVASTIFLTLVHIKLLLKISSHEREMRTIKSKQTSITSPLVQLVSFPIFGLCCWVTSSFVYVISTFVATYPFAMLIWTSVTIAPVNSVEIPLVLIGMSVSKIKLFKKGVTVKD